MWRKCDAKEGEVLYIPLLWRCECGVREDVDVEVDMVQWNWEVDTIDTIGRLI